MQIKRQRLLAQQRKSVYNKANMESRDHSGKTQLRSVELFAGCGGLAYGVADAGFQHICVIERDAAACGTLKFNKSREAKHFYEWPIHEVDVRDIDFASLGDTVDLISGGPPCQPFSIGGKHKGPSDERNMWPEATRAVGELFPKAFLFENVRGLLRPGFSSYLSYLRLQLSWPELRSNRRTWEEQLKHLEKHARSGATPTYRVVIQGINAADYGAAQKRHRAIVMGVRSDVDDDLVFPQPTHSREALIWNQWVTGDYWKKHGIPKKLRPKISESDKRILDKLTAKGKPPRELPWMTVRDAVGDLPKPISSRETALNHRLHPGARVYVGHTGSCWDEPAKALKAGSHGVPGGENVLVEDGKHVRYFTVREMARLQGFPDEFAIDSSWMGSTKQLGNAVPVQVGRIFGKILSRIIQNSKRKT